MDEIGAIEPPRTDAQDLAEERECGESERGRGVGVGGESGNRSHQQLPDGDPDDEEDVCRICRTPGDEESSLYHPCACSGSIKYVHQECLLRWLNHSNARQCEVCKHMFAFSPVYAPDAPARLPVRELFLGMTLKAFKGARFFVRLLFVTCVWLLLIPFVTLWIWRFTFVRSLVEANSLFYSRWTFGLLLTDCLHGFLLSAGIVFIFLGVTSLREYFRHLREVAGGQDGDREDDAVDRGLGGRAGRRLGQVVAGVRGFGGDGGVAVGGPHANNEVAVVALPAQGLAAGAGQLLRRNAENVALRLEMQAARLEAHVEQMFDAVEDVDGAEDVPFDELVGMQGPVSHLLENAVTVLLSNTIFLGTVALIPFTLGRIIIFVFSKIMVATGSAGTMARWSETATGVFDGNGSSLVQGLVISSAARLMGELKENNDSLFKLLADRGISSENTVSVAIPGAAVGEALAQASAFRFSDATTVAVGYMAIFSAVVFYLGLIALIRYSRGEPMTVGRIRGVASMAEAAPSVARQVMAGVSYMATGVKVAFLLFIELGVFPLLCGWWLDVCTLGIRDVTLAQAVLFFSSSPSMSSFLHWLVGIVYMLQISIFVSLLREVLKPGVLYFLRDPADPNYNPFRDLIDDPLHKHARRVLLSVVVYGSLIVMLVFLPVRLAISIAPHMFPLDIRVSDPFTEIPADMLLFHICIPFAVEHFRPRATVKTVLFHWFSTVGWALGLSEFLLPEAEQANGVGGNNNEERGVGGEERDHNFDGNHPRGGHGDVAGSRHQLETSSVDVEYEDSDNEGEHDTNEYQFASRIVLLLLGAWVTLLAFNSTMVLLPISIGRVIFTSFSRLPITRGAKCNDLYAFNIGCYVLWATAAAIQYVVGYLRTHDIRVFLRQVVKWSSIVTKSFVLLSLWIVVIPVLIGLLFELLVVVPLRVPIDESPVFLLYQDWVMLGQFVPLVGDRWRVKFEQVRNDGFSHLRGWWVFTAIVAPVLIHLLTALCVPYVFARGVFPLLGYSLTVNSAVYRYAWLSCLLFGTVWYGGHRLHQWLLDLHDTIRDDRYLVGRRLHNYGEQKKAPDSPGSLRLPSAGLADAEEGADAQVDEASEPEERKGSGEESEAAAGHAGGIASDSESVMDPAVTGAQRIGASGSTLKFRGAISHECISS
uniref:RING-type E3 ubiquitin transferase n=1 Tax=Physcomitrium patens TaxID=3218 RepID=A0A7I4FVD2_PHYPA